MEKPLCLELKKSWLPAHILNQSIATKGIGPAVSTEVTEVTAVTRENRKKIICWCILNIIVYHCILYIIVYPHSSLRSFFPLDHSFFTTPRPQTPRIHPNRSRGLLANLERMLSKNFRRCVRSGVRRLGGLPWDAEKWGAPSPSSSSSSWNDSSWFVYIYI